MSISPRTFSLLSVVFIVAGIVLTLSGFYMCAKGGMAAVFVIGIVLAVVGCILSYVDLRDASVQARKAKEPVRKSKNKGKGSR